jgi:DNA sulfur modification protein DndD
MKLISVKLKDYGLYRGEVEFDLAPRNNGTTKPVVLLGGKNGAGKTTLLGAVKLGLYGKTSLGRMSQAEYHSYLKSKIHCSRGDLLNPQDASIEILFDLVVGGEKARYKISRSWVGNDGEDPHELLRLERNGVLVEDIEPQFQQEFISSIIPENLSQLFFFDGEKIKAIADDITSNAAIADSIQTLLGLDVVQKLQADLSIHVKQQAKNMASKDDLIAIKKLEEEQAVLQDKYDGLLTGKRAELHTQLDGVESEILKCEKKLADEGASFAETLSEEKTRELEIEAQRGVIEKQIRQICEGAFPLSLCPETNKLLLSTLDKEASQQGAARVCNEIEEIKRGLNFELQNNKKLKKEPAKDLFISVVDKVLDGRKNELAADIKGEPLLACAPAEKNEIEGWLKEALTRKGEVNQLGVELEKLSRELTENRRKQNRAPDEEALQPIFLELTQLNEEKGALKERIASLEIEAAQVANELAATQRALGKILEANEKIEKTRSQIELAQKSQEALTEYAQRITEIKIESLRSSIAELFNFLIRKDDLVAEVQINPKTFEVTLFDKNNNRIGKDELSSGEKQLFAISVLWALAKSSGRPLPVIIDTPLGRLDSDHRINLVKHYFPNAAHQVIILSTDTEVDEGLFKELMPSVSHCYNLKYNMKETRTTPVEGYFWNDPPSF